MIIEAVFTLAEIDYERREVNFAEGPDELRAVNPLAQVPTVVLDDGAVMTESAAIVLWVLERSPGLGFGPGDPQRAAFLRWLLFFPAAIYPMYTVGDVPGQWVGEGDRDRLVASTIARTLRCWTILEQSLGGPDDYLLGRLSPLDIYAAVFSRWRPGRERIREVAPQIVAVAERVEQHPKLAPLFEREFAAKS